MADANVAISQITISALTVAAINRLKAASWFPWLTAEKVKLARAMSAIVAAAAAVGISYTWNPAAHSLTIDGLTLAAIWGAAWAWVKQMTLNELIFQTTKGKSDPAVVKAAGEVNAAAAGVGPVASNEQAAKG